MNRAYRCHLCQGESRWRVERRGDALVTWSCDADLVHVLGDVQRDFEVTELVVSLPGVSA